MPWPCTNQRVKVAAEAEFECFTVPKVTARPRNCQFGRKSMRPTVLAIKYAQSLTAIQIEIIFGGHSRFLSAAAGTCTRPVICRSNGRHWSRRFGIEDNLSASDSRKFVDSGPLFFSLPSSGLLSKDGADSDETATVKAGHRLIDDEPLIPPWGIWWTFRYCAIICSSKDDSTSLKFYFY